MKDYGAIAEGYFRRGCSCAQSVAAAFSEELGMPEEQVLRMLSGFGAGFGRLREVCGGFSGLTFVISTLYGSADPVKKGEIYAIIQGLAEEFKARSGGSLRCKELLGLEQPEGSAVPSQRTADYYASRPCPALVRMGAELCGAYLEAHPVDARDGARPD
ncbi:MAG: C-GCAxxG-C-C family protein [Clostridiales bacterium]|nr:C-GCAxxG-C-C family protein [Clostridiales bacterium]